MKKIAIVLALAFSITTGFAQELTSKKGEHYLPEAKDWAISFDAAPMLNYVGNLFNGATATNTSPAPHYVNGIPTGMGIVGKYYIDEKTAYRGMLRIGFGSVSNDFMIGSNADASVLVVDNMKTSSTNILLGAGKEWRRGKTRLQGYYGAMAYIALSSSDMTYTYGNAFSNTYQTPASTWGGGGSRPTETKAGSTFGLGIRGFVGAEYFVFPKISLGAEYGWGLGLSSTGQGTNTTESWDATAGGVKSTSVKTGGSSTFGIDTDINSMMSAASLNITLHF